MFTQKIKNAAAAVALVAFAAPGAGHAVTGPQPSVIDLAVELNAPGGEFEGAFDTLLAAVLVADPAVLEALAGFGQYTVFAPTDDAFAAAGLDPSNIGTLDEDTLTQILLYHVAQGRLNADVVTNRDSLRMMFGGRIQQSGGVITDNTGGQATIIVTNQRAENGIIHAIDAVILPFAL